MSTDGFSLYTDSLCVSVHFLNLKNVDDHCGMLSVVPLTILSITHLHLTRVNRARKKLKSSRNFAITLGVTKR